MTIALIGNPNNTGRRGNRIAVPQAKGDHVPLDVVDAALARGVERLGAIESVDHGGVSPRGG